MSSRFSSHLMGTLRLKVCSSNGSGAPATCQAVANAHQVWIRTIFYVVLRSGYCQFGQQHTRHYYSLNSIQEVVGSHPDLGFQGHIYPTPISLNRQSLHQQRLLFLLRPDKRAAL